VDTEGHWAALASHHLRNSCSSSERFRDDVFVAEFSQRPDDLHFNARNTRKNSAIIGL
jgi:hypothetical protein